VQLLLPFLAIFAAHWILGEEIDASVICGAVAITAIVVAGRWSLSRNPNRARPRSLTFAAKSSL
jgi:drug/metabolite transporter (DMT)-like permease